MKISVLCSSLEHPIYSHLEKWVNARAPQHDAKLLTSVSELAGGDLLFLISCTEIVGAAVRAKYSHCLIVHASALPKGRGWSPHVWQIIEGKNAIPVTLLEAADKIDSGNIWSQRIVTLEGHELYDEINAKLFAATTQLMGFAVDNAMTVHPTPQSGVEPTYYPRRTPEDSRLDPHKTIAEQFDLLRVADAERFPCFIEHRGKRYTVHLKKEDVP